MTLCQSANQITTQELQKLRCTHTITTCIKYKHQTTELQKTIIWNTHIWNTYRKCVYICITYNYIMIICKYNYIYIELKWQQEHNESTWYSRRRTEMSDMTNTKSPSAPASRANIQRGFSKKKLHFKGCYGGGYHLVMTNIANWKIHQFSIYKPSIFMGHLYHGYVK